jgi:aminoglycoside phosphotransferase (APT) family kinase protein
MPLTDDPAYLATLLQRAVPGIGPVISLERVAEGYGATTLRSATGLGIRIPHSRRLADLQYRTAPALRRLAPLLPAPIPVPLWMLPTGYPFETGAIGFRWIDGEQPDPDAASPSLIGQVGAFLAALHGIRGEVLDQFDGRVPGPADVAAERERVMGIALRWLWDRLPSATMHRLERWWNAHRTARTRARYEPRLIHGDFWHGNLLVDDSGERLAGVIDWEDVALDDPAQDLATLLHGGEEFSEDVLAAYRAAGGTVDEETLARRDAHWAYREFTGIALAREVGDDTEALDATRKLARGALRSLFAENAS